MKEFDEIDQLFQTTFDGFESTPDPSVKENIDRAIAAKKKRRGFFFLFLSLFIGTSVLGAIVYSYSSGNKTPIAENNHPSPLQDPIQIKKEISQSSTINQQKDNITQKNESNKTTDYTYKQQRIESINYIPKKENSIISKDHETLSLTGPKSIKSADNKLLITQKNDSLSEIADAHSNKVDTTLRQNNNVMDSISKNVVETIFEENNTMTMTQPEPKWFLITFLGWEGEKRKPFENIDMNDISNAGKEYAYIHSSSFYGKVEMNRKLTTRFDILTGIGFRSSKLTQSGYLYRLDSTLIEDELTASPTPDSFAYFIRDDSVKQMFRVNSIILPIGIAYSFPIGNRFHFRLSAGTEFTYGWRKNILLQSNVSEPRFHSFGWNIWMRPEIHYSYGKLRFIAFGSINHALFQQMKWDATARRNPSFGGGIGVQYNLTYFSPRR